jgi:hypothetical protein
VRKRTLPRESPLLSNWEGRNAREDCQSQSEAKSRRQFHRQIALLGLSKVASSEYTSIVEIGVKVGRVANLGTLLVLGVFLASLSLC